MKYFFWLLLIAVVIFRFYSTKPQIKEGNLVKIDGTVLSEPTSSFGSQTFNLSGIKISANSDNVHYGDFLIVEGVYKNGEVQKAKIDEIKSSYNFFIKFRNYLINYFKNGILSGILLGTKNEIPRYLYARIQNSGLSYLVTASGVKIAILSSFLMELFLLKLSRRKSILLVILFIWFYVLIAGFQPTTIKAAILVTIAFASQMFGRVKNSLRNTFIAAFIMLIAFPSWLTDYGFILSYAATITLILFNTKIYTLLRFVPELLRQDLATSISAQIGIAPLGFLFFGQVNFAASIVKSTLLLWTIAPIMLVGGLAGIISIISPGLGNIILLPLTPLLSYFITIVNL